ncbi:hypothetical protein ACLB2K_041233 [Fragaria x ananassa]
MAFRGGNASSGMGVAEDCRSTFLELQRKKAFRYVVFKIDEKKKEVVVEKTGSPVESYDDFTASLPENDCRYAIYDFDFVTSENCQKSKIFFIAWSPSVSRIRAKMLYATSKDRFRRELDGIHYEIQATDSTEMELEVLQEHGGIISGARFSEETVEKDRCSYFYLFRHSGRQGLLAESLQPKAAESSWGVIDLHCPNYSTSKWRKLYSAPGCAAYPSISAVHFEKVKSQRQMDGEGGRVR